MSAPWANAGCAHVGVSSTSQSARKACQSTSTPWRSRCSADHAGDVDRRYARSARVEERPAVVAHHGVEQRAQGADVGHQQLGPQLDHPGVAERARPPRRRGRRRRARRRAAGRRRRCRGRCRRPEVRRRRRRATGAGRRLVQGDRQRQRIAGVRPGDGEQPGAEVGDAAGHHALDGHQLEHDRRLAGGRDEACGTTPVDGLIEAMPQQCAGLRSEPPRSLPSPSGDIPLASADASPPLDPPAVTSGFHGLRVRPRSVRVGVHAQPEVGQVRAGERDRSGGPHALDDRRVDGGDGVLAGRRRPGWSAEPATSMFSLTVIGTPCSGPTSRAVGDRPVGGVGGRDRLARAGRRRR